jgi:hypothetical protein
MDVHLSVGRGVVLDDLWILGNQLIDKVTQQKHHRFVLILLLIDLIYQFLVLTQDLIQLDLGRLLLPLIVKNSPLKELGKIRLIKASLSTLPDINPLISFIPSLSLLNLFLEQLDLSFILLYDPITKM